MNSPESKCQNWVLYGPNEDLIAWVGHTHDRPPYRPPTEDPAWTAYVRINNKNYNLKARFPDPDKKGDGNPVVLQQALDAAVKSYKALKANPPV